MCVVQATVGEVKWGCGGEQARQAQLVVVDQHQAVRQTVEKEGLQDKLENCPNLQEGRKRLG